MNVEKTIQRRGLYVELSKEDRDVLAHVVIDPDAWFAHVLKTFGEEKATELLAQKVVRWKPDYEMALAAGIYKNRAERDAEELAERVVKI